MSIAGRIYRRAVQMVGFRSKPGLDPTLARMEHVFKAPPVTEELAAAIKLISPHFDVRMDSSFQLLWEADQNGACWGEFPALEPELSRLKHPAKILEIGPGMGRSLVFFSKKLGWDSDTLHAYEGNGDRTKYTVMGPRFEDSFCGNIPILKQVLEYNGVKNATVFDAREVRLADLPGPYDLIYSFYAVGFHWSLEHFLSDLQALMDDNSLAVFTVGLEFKPFPELNQFSYRVIEWKVAWPKNTRLKLLLLRKKAQG